MRNNNMAKADLAPENVHNEGVEHGMNRVHDEVGLLSSFTHT